MCELYPTLLKKKKGKKNKVKERSCTGMRLHKSGHLIAKLNLLSRVWKIHYYN